MRVEPITDPKHIKAIKLLLSTEPRNKLLFVLGINSGCRIKDLLMLKVKDLQGYEVGHRIVIREGKTAKQNVIIINQEIKNSLDEYIAFAKPSLEEYLFRSRKGVNSPLTTYRVTRLVKSWTESINLKHNTGAHTLRKTWCFIQRTKYSVPWEVLSLRLNHSSPSVTRRYMGVKEQEVEKILLNCI